MSSESEKNVVCRLYFTKGFSLLTASTPSDTVEAVKENVPLRVLCFVHNNLSDMFLTKVQTFNYVRADPFSLSFHTTVASFSHLSQKKPEVCLPTLPHVGFGNSLIYYCMAAPSMFALFSPY